MVRELVHSTGGAILPAELTMAERLASLAIALPVIAALVTPIRAQQPASKQVTVYKLAIGGLYYHLAKCPALESGSTQITLRSAVEELNLKPCIECHPELTSDVAALLPALKAAVDNPRSSTGSSPRAVTLSQLRAFATKAASTADNDPDKFRESFRSQLSPLVPEYDGAILIFEAPRGLLIAVEGPIAKFEFETAERVRKFQSAAGVGLDTTVSISVSPSQIDAPNVQRLILQRNGAIVAPLANGLVPTPMTTRMGAKEIINSGVVTYAPSAFAPAANVTLKLTAVPASGSNIVHVFTHEELRGIR